MKKNVCFISGSSPDFFGGISIYQRNLISYSKSKNLGLEFTWVYPGNKNNTHILDGVNCIELKSLKYPILREISFSKRVLSYIRENNFDIINTHANWGYCLRNYSKKESQKNIHTYHGVTMPYMKIQFERFGLLKYLFYPILPFFYNLEKPPINGSDEIICVSQKVISDLKRLYSTKENLHLIRTGVDTSKFKKLNKKKSREELNLKNNFIYGLYSGRGGYWNKGLDRAIKISKEIYKKNNNYRLIVLGSDFDKCKKYLSEEFVVYKGIVERKILPKYLSSVDFFFSLSRYEGGAPTLALIEAISCGCPTICSKDMDPEILNDGKDCIILNNYSQKGSDKIISLVKNKNKVKSISESAKEKIKNLSLEKWGKKYFEILLK